MHIYLHMITRWLKMGGGKINSMKPPRGEWGKQPRNTPARPTSTRQSKCRFRFPVDEINEFRPLVLMCRTFHHLFMTHGTPRRDVSGVRRSQSMNQLLCIYTTRWPRNNVMNMTANSNSLMKSCVLPSTISLSSKYMLPVYIPVAFSRSCRVQVLPERGKDARARSGNVPASPSTTSEQRASETKWIFWVFQ